MSTEQLAKVIDANLFAAIRASNTAFVGLCLAFISIMERPGNGFAGALRRHALRKHTRILLGGAQAERKCPW